MTVPNELRRVAVHEAGHAVIGRVLNMICGPVTALADHDSVGHSITADPWMILEAWERRGYFREPKTCFRGRILTLMAGAEAEVALLGSCQGGDGSDRHEIAMMLESEALQPGQNAVRLEARLRRAARVLCVRHSAKIDRLATALSSQNSLSDDAEIRAIAGLPAAPPLVDYWKR